MSFKYIYSLNADFPNGLIENQLLREIEENIIIITLIDHIRTDDDVVSIVFETELLQTESDELNIIISSYVLVPYTVIPFDMNSLVDPDMLKTNIISSKDGGDIIVQSNMNMGGNNLNDVLLAVIDRLVANEIRLETIIFLFVVLPFDFSTITNPTLVMNDDNQLYFARDNVEKPFNLLNSLQEFVMDEDLTITSLTTNTSDIVYTYNIPVLKYGLYKLEWAVEIANSGQLTGTKLEVQLNGFEICEHNTPPMDRNNAYQLVTRSHVLSDYIGGEDFTLHLSVTSDTGRVRNKFVNLFRISD